MSLQIVFLGTAASIPTQKRSLASMAILREGELLLFDCGEGTQRQMIQAKIGFNRRTKIFVTHLHGDHILGLPGVLQSMSLLGRDKPIQIYGPKGITKFLEAIINTVHFSLGFHIEAYNIEGQGIVCREKEYKVVSTLAEHSIPSLAFALIERARPGKFCIKKANSLGIPKGPIWGKLQQGREIQLSDGRIITPNDVLGPSRPGRKIVYVGDTKPTDSICEIAKDADVLIHESTFGKELEHRADSDLHSTPSGAAQLASKAQVKLLVLTHISARYLDPNILLQEAKDIFSNVVVAKDFMRIDVQQGEHTL